MKKLFTMFLSVILTNTVLTSNAQRTVKIDDLKYELMADEAKVIESDTTIIGDSWWDATLYSAYKNDEYVVPSVVEFQNMSFTVTELGDYAFSAKPYSSYWVGGGSTASKITLPNTIMEIGKNAFYRCYNLSSITLPSNSDFVTINPYTFGSCTSLKEIRIPNTVRKIDNHAFSASGLEDIELPTALECIGDSAFYSNKLKTIKFPSLLKSIGKRAFYGNDFTNVVIPASVSEMGGNVFEDCSFIRTLFYLSPNAPENWEAVAKTYVPDIVNYSTPTTEMNKATVKAMVTFNDTIRVYGEGLPDINDHVVNVVESGYELVGITVKNSIHTDAGVWCDTIHVQLSNKDTDVPLIDANVLYRHRVVPAKLTASVMSVSREYGEENPKFNVVYSGFVNGDDESVIEEPVEIVVNADSSSPVGTYTISLTGGKAKNYEIVYEPGSLTVTKAPLTAKVKNATRSYGTKNPEFQIEYTGLKNNETSPVWSTKPVISTAATTDSNVGQYVITADGGVAHDYELSVIKQGYLTVTKVPLFVKAENAERYYYEENPAFRNIYSGFVNGEDEDVLLEQPKATTSATKTSPAGEYPITVNNGEALNYEFIYENGTLTVKKRNLTVTTPNYERAYNEENPEIELTYYGFVNNETEEVLILKPTAVLNVSKTTDVGSYPIIINGGEAENYDFVYAGGELTITKASQILTWEQDLSAIEQGSQIKLTAEASSGLGISYIVSGTNDVFTIYSVGADTFIDCYGIGTVVLRATQNGNRNYFPAERLSKIVTVASSTGISNTERGETRVYTSPNSINIDNLPKNVDALVYSADGILLYKGKDKKVNVNKGLYVVRIGNKTYKLFVR